jgi:hypothetical protein
MGVHGFDCLRSFDRRLENVFAGKWLRVPSKKICGALYSSSTTLFPGFYGNPTGSYTIEEARVVAICRISAKHVVRRNDGDGGADRVFWRLFSGAALRDAALG